MVEDPFNLDRAAMTIYDLLQEKGTKVLILRQECALVRAKKTEKRFKVRIDPDKCLGEECGCGRLLHQSLPLSGPQLGRGRRQVQNRRSGVRRMRSVR